MKETVMFLRKKMTVSFFIYGAEGGGKMGRDVWETN